MKFLIIRTDRIGDVMLSLPVAQTIRERLPDAEISMMVAEPITELITGQPSIDRVVPYNNGRMVNAIRLIRAQGFDIAVLLHPTFALSLELFLAGVPQRIGTGYRWYSLLLNRRVYEHRRTSEMHEITYNLGLLKPLGIERTMEQPYLSISEPLRERAQSLLASYSIDKDNFVLIHPGSGGSTLSWPEQSYAQLVSLLTSKTDYALVLSGGNDERDVAERIQQKTGGRIANMAGKTTLTELAGIISLARLFIGNSTGPMHIASATGTPIVTFFPPSRANRKTRWGPLSPSIVFEPPIPYCPRCVGESCEYYNCMTLIKPEEVFNSIQKWIRNESLQ
jgi:heptosyltransferase-3